MSKSSHLGRKINTALDGHTVWFKYFEFFLNVNNNNK